ncbi:MAG: hypothetical protein ACR2MS_06405 [Weeksellaceae bacterium]
MKIVSIFAPYLYAIQYEEEKDDCYTSVINDWQDVEFIKVFYENHLSSIIDNPYISVNTFQEFWEKVYRYSSEFDESLEKANENNLLNEVFDILSLNEHIYELHAKQKAKKNFLRIYCIKVEDIYIVTGGAIKLTQKMQDHPLTYSELRKLENVKHFLKDFQIIDEESFYAYLIEQDYHD